MVASWKSFQEFSYQDTSQEKGAASLEVDDKLYCPSLGSPLGAKWVMEHIHLGAAEAQLKMVLL